MSFSTDVHRIAKNMETTVEKQAALIFIELFSDVIKDTPVDTGRLRGNWQTTKGSLASGTVNRTGAGPAIAEAHSKIKDLGTYYLTNNLPYAETAEYGKWGTGPGATVKTTRDGYSVQAPYGMVRINVQRLDSILRKYAK